MCSNRDLNPNRDWDLPITGIYRRKSDQQCSTTSQSDTTAANQLRVLATYCGQQIEFLCLHETNSTAEYWTTAIHYHASHQLIKTACQHLSSQNPHSLCLHVPSFLQVFFSLGHIHAFNCHSLSLALVKSGLVLPFWYWLTRAVPDRCVCVCVCVSRGGDALQLGR